MLGISGTELLFIGLFAFIIFGPDKVPEIVRTVNKAIKMFKNAQQDMEALVKAEMAGIDLEKPLFDLNPESKPQTGAAPAKTSTTASSLYGLFEDDEEDEE